MKILDVLKKDAIILELKAQDKLSVLKELIAQIESICNINEEEVLRVLLDREELGSTGIGGGVGIPHGKIKTLENLIIVVGLSRKGVDFESLDGWLTYIFFLLVTPESSSSLHLKVLARISKILKNEAFKWKLRNAADQEEIYSIIREVDEEF